MQPLKCQSNPCRLAALKVIRLVLIVLVSLSVLSACSTNGGMSGPGDSLAADTVDPQHLVWPHPPEIARIRYLYSFSEAKDLHIYDGFFARLWSYFKGDVEKKIVQPYGIKKDDAGRLFIVDSFYKIVHVYDEKNSAYYSFPDKPIKDFNNPVNVAVSSTGRVYVSDSASARIHVFENYGKTYAGSFGADVLKRPTDMFIDRKSQQLYVVDTLNSAIVIFDQQSLHAVAQVGQHSQERDGLHFPTAITQAPSGAIYVTDSLNFRVQQLSDSLEFVRSFGHAGDGPGTFSRPKGIATDSEGHVYVVDALFGNVQVFSKEGALLMDFGNSGHGAGEFWLPNEIFIDKQDRIYVSDAYNNRIQVFQYLSYGLGE